MSNEIQAVSVKDLQIIAEEASKSRLFGLDKSQAFTLGLLAQARGLNPVEAFLRYHVIDGRPSMKPEAMLAEFQRGGGNVEWVVSNGEECRGVFRHPKHAPKGFEVIVTLRELYESGVAATWNKKGEKELKKNYRQFPAQMLRARCVSQGVRAIDPGVILGVYTPEEIGDFDARVVETKARRAPEPEALTPDEIGDELVGQMDAQRVKDRHAPVAAEVQRLKEHTNNVDARQHVQVITAACNHVNGAWRDDCETYELDYQPLANVFQVQNHLGTWAVDEGLIDASKIEGENGKRDRTELIGLLSRLEAKNPGRFASLVGDYCVGKLDEARKAANLAEYASDEPEVVAEDESQEVVEVEVVEG